MSETVNLNLYNRPGRLREGTNCYQWERKKHQISRSADLKRFVAGKL